MYEISHMHVFICVIHVPKVTKDYKENLDI